MCASDMNIFYFFLLYFTDFVFCILYNILYYKLKNKNIKLPSFSEIMFLRNPGREIYYHNYFTEASTNISKKKLELHLSIVLFSQWETACHFMQKHVLYLIMMVLKMRSLNVAVCRVTVI